MKIAFITNRYYSAVGGSETFTKALAETLVNRGHEVTVYTSNFRDWYGQEKLHTTTESINGVTVNRLPSFRVFGKDALTIIPTLQNYVVELNKYDLIQTFAYGYFVTWFPALLKFLGRLKVPVILFPQYNGKPQYPKILTAFFDLSLGALSLRTANATVIETPMHEAFFRSKTKSLRIIPSTIARPINISPLNASHLGYSSDSILITVISRLSVSKRIDCIIHGFLQLKKLFASKDLRLIIAGAGEEKEKLQELAIDPAIHFIGQVEGSNKENLLRATSVFISLSAVESFGLTLVEALQYEIPIVASNIFSHQYILKGSENYIVQDANDSAEVAEKILLAIKSSNSIRESNHTFKLKYDIETVTDRYLEVYGAVLPKK